MPNSSGQVNINYTGLNLGQDSIQAFTWISGQVIASGKLTQDWNAPTGGTGDGGGNPTASCSISSDWLSSPAQNSVVSGSVPLILAANKPSGSGLPAGAKIQYYPANNPSSGALVTIYTTTATASGPTTLTNLDTTLLPNGAYYVRVMYTDGSNNCQSSLTYLKVTGEYKPGRVRFTVSDLTIPLAGFPVSIDRTYDSLERNLVGDFGNGWTLSYGSPRLEVSPDHDVTLTFPDGKRSRFAFAPQPGLWVLGFLQQPGYQAEPGLYGSLASDGCGLVVNRSLDINQITSKKALTAH